MIGEFAALDANFAANAQARGYDGVLAWSYSGVDGAGAWSNVRNAYSNINLNCQVDDTPPPPPPTSTPAPIDPTAVPPTPAPIDPTAVPPTPFPPTPTPAPIDPTPPPSSCTGKNILFVAFKAIATGDDALMVERLTGMGHTVTVVDQKQVSARNATGMDLVLISSSTTTPKIRTMFRTTAVPVMIWEARWFRTMDLTVEQGRSYGYLAAQTTGVIADPTHPLAAGLSGTVTLSTAPVEFYWGAAHDTAVTALTSTTGQPLLYGYEAGEMMESIPAPARRVVYYGGEAGHYTNDGWLLFETAVSWALGCQ